MLFRVPNALSRSLHLKNTHTRLNFHTQLCPLTLNVQQTSSNVHPGNMSAHSRRVRPITIVAIGGSCLPSVEEVQVPWTSQLHPRLDASSSEVLQRPEVQNILLVSTRSLDIQDGCGKCQPPTKTFRHLASCSSNAMISRCRRPS